MRCWLPSEGHLMARSQGLGLLGPSPQHKGARAATPSPLFSLRCHGAGSVSTSSQQLPRRPVPNPWDPCDPWDPSWDSSWDSLAS